MRKLTMTTKGTPPLPLTINIIECTKPLMRYSPNTKTLHDRSSPIPQYSSSRWKKSRNKSLRPDGISPDIVKLVVETVSKKIRRVMNNVICSGESSSKWEKPVLCYCRRKTRPATAHLH